MKNQFQHLQAEANPPIGARQAIELISKWVEERYPKLSSLSKIRIIQQCLSDVIQEERRTECLN